MKKILLALVTTVLVVLAGCGTPSKDASKKTDADAASQSSKRAAKASSKKAAEKSSQQRAKREAELASQKSAQASSEQAAKASSEQAAKASAEQAKADSAPHAGVPAALVGTYKAKEKQAAAGFPETYTFTTSTIDFGASGMPEVLIQDVSWHMENGQYVLNGTGQPAGIYKGGAETRVIKLEGNRIYVQSNGMWYYKE